MERAAFVVEGGEGRGTRIDCRFNPSEVVLERVGGVRPRSLSGARIGGRNAAEDPLLFTGGGETRLTLKLLFDTTSEEIPRSPWLPRVPGEPPRPRVDVRSKTRPLWDMAGGAAGDVGGDRELPRGRFIWGKAWNLPVAVLALSERLDFFDPHGTPLRSWVHIRLRKLPEPPPIIVWPDLIGLAVAAARIIAFAGAVALADGYVPTPGTLRHSVQDGDTLPSIAARYYRAPWLWRIIAIANGVSDPADVEDKIGLQLWIPPSEELPSIGTRGGS